jgi:hypothetical protein
MGAADGVGSSGQEREMKMRCEGKGGRQGARVGECGMVSIWECGGTERDGQRPKAVASSLGSPCMAFVSGCPRTGEGTARNRAAWHLHGLELESTICD